MSVIGPQNKNLRTYLKGCSALKMLEAVGWEKGTLESSMGEKAVDEVESGRSVALVVPFCICLSQSVSLPRWRPSGKSRVTDIDRSRIWCIGCGVSV